MPSGGRGRRLVLRTFPALNRNAWGRVAQYGHLVTGPMKVSETATGALPALIRYVEIKALAGGVTTRCNAGWIEPDTWVRPHWRVGEG